ncbi:MAG: hypothetical protein ACI9D0_000179 [Bacteroidia bacterium]|jgi:predicted esterase
MKHLALLLCLPLAAAAIPGDDAPKPSDLIDAYLGSHGDPVIVSAERGLLLEQMRGLGEAGELTSKQAKDLARKFEKAQKDLPQLNTKPATIHSFYEPDLGPDGQGRYMLGGDTNKPKTLLISLHGSGGYGDKLAKGTSPLFKPAMNRHQLAVVPNIVDRKIFWTDPAHAQLVIDLIDASLRTFPSIDPNHVTVTGFSGGSLGSWVLGAWYADRFGMVAPAGGGPFESSTTLGMIPNLRNTPMKIHQYEIDGRMPSEHVQEAVKLMEEARAKWGGYDFEYIEHEGAGHKPPPGGMAQWIKELPEAARIPRPTKLCWQPHIDQKQQFSWLYYSGVFPGPVVVAELDTKTNSIHIEVEGDASGLSVLLDDDLLNLNKSITITVGEETVYEGKPTPQLSTIALTHLTPDPALHFTTQVDVMLRKAQ